MANEIPNRAKAGAFIAVFPDPTPPTFFGGWGVLPATLRRASLPSIGQYLIDLEQPGSGLINEAVTGFESLAQLVTWGSNSLDGGSMLAAVVANPDLPPQPVFAGKSINLGTILLQVSDALGSPIDQSGAISVVVHAIPQQV